MVFFVVSIVMVGVAALLAFCYARDWARWRRSEAEYKRENERLQAVEERMEVLAGAERQIVVRWDSRDSNARVEGDPEVVGTGGSPDKVLAFADWASSADASMLEQCVGKLRDEGEGFSRTLRTRSGGFVSVEGRTSRGKAFVRMSALEGARGEILRMDSELRQAQANLTVLTTFLDSIGHPVWLRDSEEKLIWLNKAYLSLVGAHSLEDVQTRSLELLERQDLTEARVASGQGRVFMRRIESRIGDERRVLDVMERPTRAGRAGLALDISTAEQERIRMKRDLEVQVRTLDQLDTAVAVFDDAQQLIFHNSAFQRLWRLDPHFLENKPLDGEILEQLRTRGQLPEQGDFREFKKEFLAAYNEPQAREFWWILPDRRSVRVLSSPNAYGGLTYLYYDESDRFRMQTQMDTSRRVQNETLDALREGVAAFGSDGRLKYCNRAFEEMWKFAAADLEDEPHVDAIIEHCAALTADKSTWDKVRGAVTGLHEMRLGIEQRFERQDARTVDCCGQPLPDGATLLTFSDVTASVGYAKALTETNEALEKAGRLRDDFVHHFSYQVRTPLTNVIGFIELLNDESVGMLNRRQKDYVTDSLRSASALLAILDDILDLASIDTGSLELVLEDVDIRKTVRAAERGLKDQLEKEKLTLEVIVEAGAETVRADSKRMRQILFHLISNAVAFSEPNQVISVIARHTGEGVEVDVRDRGCGISKDLKEKIFDRFVSVPRGARQGGLGLGLSIVRSLVELHGGRVTIESKPGEGTVVKCFFPRGETVQGAVQ
jgi:signal transduction histidine kinase